MTFAEKASEFTAKISVRRVDSEDMVDGKSIMQMLMLAGTMGTKLELTAEGEDADEALEALKTLVNGKFDEEE